MSKMRTCLLYSVFTNFSVILFAIEEKLTGQYEETDPKRFSVRSFMFGIIWVVLNDHYTI